MVEALFAVDHGEKGHTDDHRERNRILKKTTRYQQIWKYYHELFKASLSRGYLRENSDSPTHEVFSKWMTPSRVKTEALDHWLRQIEASAARLANDSTFTGGS